jgi:hypothetical protein
MNTSQLTRSLHQHALLGATLFTCVAGVLMAAPAGPTPQIPEGGGAPGAYPNTSVTAVNVIAKGSTTFNSNVEITGFDGQGPIDWSITKYNRGDLAMRFAPADSAAAVTNLNQGFIDFTDNAAGAASQAWRPSRSRGVVIGTARQNGPIDWNDGEGALFPTVGLSWSSSGPGYSMLDGSFGTGDLDINTGRAGTHASSPEANFAFSVSWFPFDQGWIGGDVGNPVLGDPEGLRLDGSGQWTAPNAHSAGITAGMVVWPQLSLTGTYGGLATLRLPGVDSLEDGMIFTTSSDGSSDVNIVGVLPKDDGSSWIVTIREDSETTAETLASDTQSEFEFVYVPFNAVGLIGGHIAGTTGAKRKAAGDFTVTRTSTGTYELTIPGKTGSDGTLLLQVADVEAGTSDLLASRAFLSYEYQDGKFIIQSRKTATDTTADLTDASFYVAWIDFTAPLSMPEGPRFRTQGPIRYSGDFVIAQEAGLATHTTEPEVLVTTIDSGNAAGWVDPVTQQTAIAAVVGRFYDPNTLAATSDPFLIIANPSGAITRHDVKFNPVSKQYVVVANTRAHGTTGANVVTVATVKPGPVADPLTQVAKSVVHNIGADANYDDVAVAVSTKNGNILMIAEHNFTGEGEGVIGVLYDKDLTALTPTEGRIDRLQPVGDEDDPDVTYLPEADVFLYTGNTDNSNGSTGTLHNRIVSAIIQTVPDGTGALQSTVEQTISDGLPAGRDEGHPATLENPFTGQLITAYDGGNGTPFGDLSYFTLGAAPAYTLTSARAETNYTTGMDGNPFRQQHPQLAADPVAGVIVVGFNANGSDIGLPSGYVYRALGTDGLPLPSVFPIASFLADAPGGLGNSADYHNIKYSPVSGSFIAVYASSSGGAYLASLQVTSELLAVAAPSLSIARDPAGAVVAWPSSATGFSLQSTLLVSPTDWQPVSGTPTQANGTNKLTVPATDSTRFYRLIKP